MIGKVFELICTPNFFYSIIRMATPLIFASMAALISTKSGTVNIIIDGSMLMSALMGNLISAFTGSLFWGMLAGCATGTLMGGFLALFHVKMKAPANLTGVAINLFTTGFSVFLCYVCSGDKGSTSQLTGRVFPTIDIPLIKEIPFIGKVLSGHNIITYLALATIILVWLFIYKTPLGLRIRTVGENPDAASSVGENPNRIKIIALLIAGFVSSWGGMFLSMGYVSWFTRNMTNARGFIGVAANAVGQGNPLWVALTTFVFAVSDALTVVLQSLMVPTEFTSMLPYVLTLTIVILMALKYQGKRKNLRKKAIEAILQERRAAAGQTGRT